MLFRSLLAAWQRLAPGHVHFGSIADGWEDEITAAYLEDTARQTGLPTTRLAMAAIGWNTAERSFTDEEETPIRTLFKLYPWEWMIRDHFGPYLANDTCGVLEPPWKALLSDKAILAVLWRLFPGHPNLLETVPGRIEIAGGDCVQKPCLGREGANIAMLRAGRPVASTEGPYAPEEARFVTQALAKLPQREGWNALIGSWMVGEESAGIILRESRAAILRDTSRVVPHLFA